METKPLDARQLQEVCQEMQKQIYEAEREIRLLQSRLLEKQSYIDGISAAARIAEVSYKKHRAQRLLPLMLRQMEQERLKRECPGESPERRSLGRMLKELFLRPQKEKEQVNVR